MSISIETLMNGDNEIAPKTIANAVTMNDQTTLQETLDNLNTYITPEMFGAKGDGVTSDTDAIQACFDYVVTQTTKETHPEVNFQSNKTYLVTNTLTIGNGDAGINNQRIRINGNGCRILLQPSVHQNLSTNLLEIGVNGTEIKLLTIKNIKFMGDFANNAHPYSNHGIVLKKDTTDCVFEDVTLNYFGGDGLHCESNNWANRFSNCEFSFNGLNGFNGFTQPIYKLTGNNSGTIYYTNQLPTTTSQAYRVYSDNECQNVVNDVFIKLISGTSYKLNNGSSDIENVSKEDIFTSTSGGLTTTHFINCHFLGNMKNGILGNGSQCSIFGGYIETSKENGIKLLASPQMSVTRMCLFGVDIEGNQRSIYIDTSTYGNFNTQLSLRTIGGMICNKSNGASSTIYVDAPTQKGQGIGKTSGITLEFDSDIIRQANVYTIDSANFIILKGKISFLAYEGLNGETVALTNSNTFGKKVQFVNGDNFNIYQNSDVLKNYVDAPITYENDDFKFTIKSGETIRVNIPCTFAFNYDTNKSQFGLKLLGEFSGVASDIKLYATKLNATKYGTETKTIAANGISNSDGILFNPEKYWYKNLYIKNDSNVDFTFTNILFYGMLASSEYANWGDTLQ